MRLSPAAELAIRGLLTLTECCADGPVTLETICRKRKLPKQYLTKIFGTLGRAGLVRPVRGKKGGYKLGRPPEKITILDVIQAVEGPIVLNYCQYTPSQCDQSGCPLNAVWAELQQIMRQKLGAMTLAACKSPGAPKSA